MNASELRVARRGGAFRIEGLQLPQQLFHVPREALNAPPFLLPQGLFLLLTRSLYVLFAFGLLLIFALTWDFAIWIQ